MDAKKKKILRVSGVAVAAAASAASYLVTKELVDLAFDRNEPKAAKRAGRMVSGTHGNQVFLQERAAAAERLEQQANETVQILSHDGVVLTGHWFEQPGAKRALIAVHGWRSSWSKDFGMTADFWHANDCNVLYIEQRGQNNSGGAYMGLGLIERYDCLDWIRWVIQRCGEDMPIYLGGISMGATTVLMATGLNLPPNVRGVAADCGFTTPRAIAEHVAKNNLHIGFGARGALANAMCKRKISVGIDEYSTIDAMKQCKVPVLFVHGEKDHFVPVSMTYQNYEACQAPKKMLIVPGADHGMSYYLNPEAYQAAIRAMWEKYD